MAFLKSLSPTTKWILAGLVLGGLGVLIWGAWGALGGLVALLAAKKPEQAREEIKQEHQRIDARTEEQVEGIEADTAKDVTEIRARTEERVEDPTDADLARMRAKFGGGDGDAGRSGS